MDAETQPLEAGTKLNSRLTVLGTIDKDGREPVYIVWHHRAWCPMACKTFALASKLQRESDILSALAHPNIVRCLGTEDAKHLLMEFLEGPTLSQLRREQPKECSSVPDAMRVAIHLGAALQHVHERGFLHMDVKPSNVIVTHGRPVLFDFGIARFRNEPRPPRSAGTAPYMAPEECLCEPVTPAADVFGLGVTIYKLLTAHYPFSEGTPEVPYPQILQTPTSARHYRRRIPARLDRLVLRCLARDPAARPSMTSLIPVLHEFIRTGPAMWPPGFRPEENVAVDRVPTAPLAPAVENQREDLAI
jgi:eukaryotic-like serine/threonine-protein kinase